MNVTKVNKTQARKMYEQGKSLYLLPSKVGFCLNAPFMAPYEISKQSCNNEDFDKIVNTYAYYNCNQELGRTVSYYKNN